MAKVVFNFVRKYGFNAACLILASAALILVYDKSSQTSREIKDARAELNDKTLRLFSRADSKIDRLDNTLLKLKKEGFVEADDFASVARKITQATVLVARSSEIARLTAGGTAVIEKTEDPSLGAGTGFFVRSNGLIVTAKHVTDAIGKDNLVIQAADGKTYQAEFIAEDSDADLALVKIDGRNYPAVDLGYFDNLAVGDEVGLAGYAPNAGALKILVHRGVVSSKQSGPGGGRSEGAFTINAFVNKGNSGGPVFSAKTGRVVGIISARQRDVSSDKFIKLPAGYKSGFTLGNIDPLKLSVDLYNQTLQVVGDVSQVGIGVALSADAIRAFMEKY